MAHYEPPHQDLRCLQIQLFSSLVPKELKSNQQPGHTETRPRFKVLSERLEKRGNRSCDPWFGSGSLAGSPLHHRRSIQEERTMRSSRPVIS